MGPFFKEMSSAKEQSMTRLGIWAFPGPCPWTAEALGRGLQAGPPCTVAGLRPLEMPLAERVSGAEFQLGQFAEPWGCTLHPKDTL